MNSDKLEYLYSTHQLATTLDIGRSTVNKYTRSLEDAGYEFLKDNNGHRTYAEHDVITLRSLLELLARGVEYNSAIKAIVERYKPSFRSDDIVLPATLNSDSDLAIINDKVDQLIYAVTQLSERINDIVDERVRVEVSTAALEISGQVNQILDEVRSAQERTDQKLEDLGSRIEQHGKRKKFLGLF